MKVARFALLLALALGTLPLIAPATAAADDPEPEVSTEPAEPAAPRDIWDRMLAVEITGGIDTPYGLVGGAVVVTPFRNLALDLGGGVSRDGGRVAGGLRLVLPHANGALGFRVGFAGGPLSWDTTVPGQPGRITDGSDVPLVTQRRTWDFVGFFDASISLEIRFDMGVYTRVDLGVEHALASADHCDLGDGAGSSACTNGAGGSGVPMRSYLQLSVGYAFDL